MDVAAAGAFEHAGMLAPLLLSSSRRALRAGRQRTRSSRVASRRAVEEELNNNVGRRNASRNGVGMNSLFMTRNARRFAQMALK